MCHLSHVNLDLNYKTTRASLYFVKSELIKIVLVRCLNDLSIFSEMGTRTHFYLFNVELLVSGACWQNAPRPLAENSDWSNVAPFWGFNQGTFDDDEILCGKCKCYTLLQFSRVLVAGCWFVNHVSILSAQESKSVIKSSNCRGLHPSVQRGKTIAAYSIIKMHHRVIPFHIKWLVGFLRAKLCCSFRNKTSFMIFLFSIPLFIKVSDHMVNVNCDLIDLERALGLSSWKKASSVTLCFWVKSNVTCRSKWNRGHLKTLSHLILWRTG